MFKKFLSKTNLMVVCILFLAAFLRLYRIQDYMTFLGDEGRDVLVVWNILHGHPTLLGPTASVGGFFLGPLYYYFMTPFLWLFNYNPVGPAVMVALFGIATVWLVYFIGQKFYSKTTGLVAASLYAISPLVIAYSRSSWNPNLMPFFSLLTLWFVYQGVRKFSLRELFFSGISLGIALQLHYLSTFLGVIVAVYVLSVLLYTKYKKSLQWNSTVWIAVKAYLSMLGGFLIGWSLFLLFEIRHGFANTRSIFDFILHSKETGTNPQLWDTVGNVFFRLFGRLTTDYPAPEQVSLQGHTLITIWFYATILLALIAVGILVYQVIASIKNHDKFLQRLLLVVWLALGVILFGFYKKQIYDYYLAFLFPLPFLLIGETLALLWKNKWARVLAVISFFALAIINLQAIPFRYPPNRQLNQMETISQFVLSKTDNKPFNFALITGGNSDQAYRYFFTVWNRAPVTIENYAIDPQRKSVTDQLLIVCETECHPLGDSLWEVAGFGRAEIKGEWQVSVVKVYKLVHYSGK